MAGVLWPKIAEFVCIKCNIYPDLPILFVYNSQPENIQAMAIYGRCRGSALPIGEVRKTAPPLIAFSL